MDLVIERGSRRIGIEIKFSSAPRPSRGFWQSIDDLQLDRAYIVAPVRASFPLADRVDVLPVHELSRATSV